MSRSVLDQAQDFSGGVVAAARQRDRWAKREAITTDAEKREQYREAIADLEARYSDLGDIPVGGAEAFARARGHGSGSRSPTHEGRRRPGGPTRRPRPTATPQKRPSGPRKAPSRRSRPTSGATPRVDQAIRQTGIPATLAGGQSAAMALLGGTIGLALLYLLLSSAETPGSGAAALPDLLEGGTGALRRFLSLEDFFPGPHVGVVPGAKPVRERPSQAEVEKVLRESGKYPGEKGRGGKGATLSNPAAELQPRRNPRRRSHR